MIDLKALNSTLEQLETERGISRETILETIEDAMAAAYKRDYGKKGQIIRAKFDPKTGKAEFSQVKIVVDDSMLKPESDDEEAAAEGGEFRAENSGREEPEEGGEERKIRFNPERHIMINEAKKIKKLK